MAVATYNTVNTSQRHDVQLMSVAAFLHELDTERKRRRTSHKTASRNCFGICVTPILFSTELDGTSVCRFGVSFFAFKFLALLNFPFVHFFPFSTV